MVQPIVQALKTTSPFSLCVPSNRYKQPISCSFATSNAFFNEFKPGLTTNAPSGIELCEKFHNDPCSICLEMVSSLDVKKYCRYTCCGKVIHITCKDELHASKLSDAIINSCQHPFDSSFFDKGRKILKFNDQFTTEFARTLFALTHFHHTFLHFFVGNVLVSSSNLAHNRNIY